MAPESPGKIPYLSAYGNITRALDKIKTASVPDRFTVDFLQTKLGLSGGGARPIIPFLKRAGFLSPDGSPTARYRQFRNSSASGSAAANAMREAYSALYELNEYVHDASDNEVKGLIVQLTGLEPESTTLKAMHASFKALNAYADFEAGPPSEAEEQKANGRSVADPEPKPQSQNEHFSAPQLRLGYTINLNLPNTSDVAVFNAIFKSLRDHLLPQARNE